MSNHPKKILRRVPKRELESPVVSRLPAAVKRPLLKEVDYHAPLTAHTLAPNSKWIIVRNNLHAIRSYGIMKRMSVVDPPFRDWYLFFQMRRELKRAEEQIRAIKYQPDFKPIHYFDLRVNKEQFLHFNVSHVRPNDGIYYAGLSAEPLVLEYLLYYFSKQNPVTYDSLFYSFLSDVNSVLYTNRQRIQRVVVFRRVALIIALAVFIIIIIMFFSLILSVITTTSNIRAMYRDDPDGGIEWRQSNAYLSADYTNEQR